MLSLIWNVVMLGKMTGNEGLGVVEVHQHSLIRLRRTPLGVSYAWQKSGSVAAAMDHGLISEFNSL